MFSNYLSSLYIFVAWQNFEAVDYNIFRRFLISFFIQKFFLDL